MLKIGIDAGHGGSNSTAGKRDPDGRYEWDYNDLMVRAFLDELAKYEGITTKRFDDATGRTDVPLKTRTDQANAWGADYYLSIHQNALHAKWGTHGGTETFHHPKSSEGKRLAEVVHKAVRGVFGLRDRGLKDGSHLWVIRKTNMPAILLEGGFMDSLTDIHTLRSKERMESAGRAIATAIATWQKLRLRKATPTPPKPAPEKTLYRVREAWVKVSSQLGAYEDINLAKALANKHTGYSVYDPTGKVVYTPSVIGKAIEAKVNGLRYYKRPSWEPRDAVGLLAKGKGFSTIIARVQVGSAFQYKVQDAEGQVFYITTNEDYVAIK